MGEDIKKVFTKKTFLEEENNFQYHAKLLTVVKNSNDGHLFSKAVCSLPFRPAQKGNPEI